MTIDFNALRARRGSSFEAINKKAEQTGGSGGFKKDERLWKPVANKENKSSNVIRFLPVAYVDMVAANEGKVSEADLVPMAKILHYSFQGPTGSWFIEKSPQTFGEKSPVREHDGPLWKQAKDNNDETLKNILKKRLPKTTYYANILVIKDGTNPENNGKIMIYEFGETVRKLLEKADKPEFDTESPFDPFDPWEGKDLILNLTYQKKKIGDREANVPNFDNVKWSDVRPLAGGDETEIERIWKEQHSIADFYNRKHFKNYDDLKAKFVKVMGIEGGTEKAAERKIDENLGSGVAPAPSMPSAPAPSVGGTATDDDLAEFELLMAGV